jgi:pimeloyl-ACP methyl ester carboxylesterase
MDLRGLLMASLALVALLGMAPIASADALTEAPSRFATLEGMRVRYKSLGEGRSALVLVHGWTCDLTFWRRQAPLFAGRRVLLVDLPGHGGSDKPEIAYTMTLFARALEAVMREAGVEKAVLVGHSMGTPVVRQFYRLFPEKTIAIVAVDGALRPFFQDPAQHAKFVDRYRGPDYLTVVGGMIDAMMSDKTPPADREAIRAAMLATPKHVLVSAADGMGEPGVLTPDPIGVPVLAIGANPARWTAEYEAYLRGFIAELDFQVMDGVGHFLMIDDPEGFNRRLEVFLAQRGLLKDR